MREYMSYSEAAEKYNLQPVSVFCPDGKDFNVYVEDNIIYVDEDYARGDILIEL